jgi:hypothetical protein
MSDLYFPMLTVMILPSRPRAEAEKVAADLTPFVEAWLKDHGLNVEVKPA